MDKSGQMGSGQVDRQSGKPQSQQTQAAGGRKGAPQAGQTNEQPQQMGGSVITDWASI